MRPPAPLELLNLVERGAQAPGPQRMLLVLEAAVPEATPDALARLPIGRRDALLLQLRELLFGPEFEAMTPCPGCNDRLEVVLDMSDVRRPLPDLAPESVRIGVDEFRFRLPNSLDLLAVAEEADPAARGRMLWRRCVEGSGAGVSEQVRAAVSDAMRRCDPQAEATVPLQCPACGHAWNERFDIAGFLWDEIHAWSLRTLREVHALASAYGWSEAAILSLSPTRRRRYLELVQA